jgi:hypothetical protein
MSSEDERIALTNLAQIEALIFLAYWARQQGVIVQHSIPPVEETYPQAPPPSPVEQSLPPPEEDEVYLMCDEDFDLIEVDLGIQEMTPDEFTEFLAAF